MHDLGSLEDQADAAAFRTVPWVDFERDYHLAAVANCRAVPCLLLGIDDLRTRSNAAVTPDKLLSFELGYQQLRVVLIRLDRESLVRATFLGAVLSDKRFLQRLDECFSLGVSLGEDQITGPCRRLFGIHLSAWLDQIRPTGFSKRGIQNLGFSHQRIVG